MKLCDWCQGTDDVQLRNGENLCLTCRAVIAFQNILSTTGEKS